MAFGNKLRNRIVGVLVIVSIILILLPVMMQDRPVPNEPINEKPIAVNEEGAITDENGLTTREGVYAGGDAVTGAATVILAMGAGKVGAAAIDEYIKEK